MSLLSTCHSPYVVFERVATTRREHVRIEDTSHATDWRNNSLQEMRTFERSVLRNTETIDIFRFDFLIAFLQFFASPNSHLVFLVVFSLQDCWHRLIMWAFPFSIVVTHVIRKTHQLWASYCVRSLNYLFSETLSQLTRIDALFFTQKIGDVLTSALLH